MKSVSKLAAASKEGERCWWKLAVTETTVIWRRQSWEGSKKPFCLHHECLEVCGWLIPGMRDATARDKCAGRENIFSGTFSCLKYSLMSISTACIILVLNRGHVVSFKEGDRKVTSFPTSQLTASHTSAFSKSCFSCSAWEGTLTPGQELDSLLDPL